MKKDDLNKKQRYALDTMLSGSNVFLTGDAGTGKTTVIQTFIDEAEKAGKNILVSATTGIAADNIGYGATTVHRALNISIKFEDYKKKVKSRAELLKEADVLIIDEISMCRFDLFNMIAKTIITENEERAVDRLLIGEDKEDIQLIVIGDFYQLRQLLRQTIEKFSVGCMDLIMERVESMNMDMLSCLNTGKKWDLNISNLMRYAGRMMRDLSMC